MKNKPLLSGKILWFVVAVGVAFAISVGYFAWSVYIAFTSTGLPSEMATFKSQQFHISIEYPRTWVALELPQGSHGDDEAIAVIGGVGPVARARVFIARRSFSQPTIDDVAQWGLSRIETGLLPGETLDLGPTSASNGTSLIRRYSDSSQTLLGRASTECMDWFTYTGSNGYDLSFCVGAKYWAQMESLFLEMARSFRAEQDG